MGITLVDAGLTTFTHLYYTIYISWCQLFNRTGFHLNAYPMGIMSLLDLIYEKEIRIHNDLPGYQGPNDTALDQFNFQKLA